MIQNIRAPRWADPDQSAIIVDADLHGETVPVAVRSGTNTDYIEDAYQRAIAGEFGPISAFIEDLPPVPSQITFAQLLITLVGVGLITEAEGEAWLSGTLPATIAAVIETLPEAVRFAAKARALRPSVVQRSDPMVAALGASRGMTEAQLDEFFWTASKV